MRNYLLTTDRVQGLQQHLMGSYLAKIVLLGYPLLKWYLEKELVVSKVSLLVDYIHTKAFSK